MKKTASRVHAFARARLLVIVIIAIVALVFGTSTALMKGPGVRRGNVASPARSNRSAVKPDKGNIEIELFVNQEDEASRQVRGPREEASFLRNHVTANGLANSALLPTAMPQSTPIFQENFDGVTAPNLPAGWTATQVTPSPTPTITPTPTPTPPTPLWVTSNSGSPTPVADSSPNAAFTQDPPNVVDNRLDSPSILITTATAQLTFRNNYDLEYGDLSGAAFDGAVLEISISGISGGAFTDIITAGGSFVTGGYNKTISNGFGNPIAGRAAWSGSSNGFISTIVNLPASAAGHTIVLRWRMGSDQDTSGAGWRIDSIAIQPSTT